MKYRSPTGDSSPALSHMFAITRDWAAKLGSSRLSSSLLSLRASIGHSSLGSFLFPIASKASAGRCGAKLKEINAVLCLFAIFCSFVAVVHFRTAARPSSTPRAIPTVWIVSNRRSGTHLSMDLLANVLQPPFRLVKANHVYLTESTLLKDLQNGINCECLNFMRRTGKIVHAHRDIRDVITSHFYYYQTFKPRIMANISRAGYFANERGVRNRDISQWVNTTTPWFEQPDVFQLPFSDALSGFRLVHRKLAAFTTGRPALSLEEEPSKISTMSNAVARHAGKGDHGYKLTMNAKVADDILRTAREMQARKLESMASCPPRSDVLSRLVDSLRDSVFAEGGAWVGGRAEYGLFAPPYCPKVLNTSKVTIAINYLGDEGKNDVAGTS